MIDSAKTKYVLDKIYEMVVNTVNEKTVEELLFTKRGEKKLYSSFPSQRVREWALKRQAEYGFPQTERDIDILLYECMRLVYKSIEFDLGRNVNIGWIYTTGWGIKGSLEKILFRKLGFRDGIEAINKISMEEENKLTDLVEQYASTIMNYLLKLADNIRKKHYGNISIGALRWYESMGRPSDIKIIEWKPDKGLNEEK